MKKIKQKLIKKIIIFYDEKNDKFLFIHEDFTNKTTTYETKDIEPLGDSLIKLFEKTNKNKVPNIEELNE